jgi:hypothetical protein
VSQPGRVEDSPAVALANEFGRLRVIQPMPAKVNSAVAKR